MNNNVLFNFFFRKSFEKLLKKLCIFLRLIVLKESKYNIQTYFVNSFFFLKHIFARLKQKIKILSVLLLL